MVEEEEELQQYHQGVADSIEFQGWFFGHFHEDIEIDKFRCVMEKIIRLS